MEGFLKAVSNGKPVIGLHAATAALYKDENREKYIKVIETQFAGHQSIHRFPVDIKEKNHPITKNIGPFEIYDEMCFFRKYKRRFNSTFEAVHKERGKTAIA